MAAIKALWDQLVLAVKVAFSNKVEEVKAQVKAEADELKDELIEKLKK